MSELKSISEEEFQTETKNGIVLVDFWAPWCGTCRMMIDVIEGLKDTFKDKISAVKVNVDEEENLAKQFDVVTLPTLILFKDGKEVERSVGFKLKVALIKMIENHL